MRRLFGSVLLLAPFLGNVSKAELLAGRGGFFVEAGLLGISSIRGNTLSIGGYGVGMINDVLRMGGGGAAGLSLFSNPGSSLTFGYGGPLIEYSFTNWLSGRLMFGGGGFGQQTPTATTGGGFLVLYPNVCFEIIIGLTTKATITLGYFVTTEPTLTTFTLGVGWLFSR